MSEIPIAEAIDRLVDSNQAFVAESETSLTVSRLFADDASELRNLCSELGWAAELFDRADDQWPENMPTDADYAPYRLMFTKPEAPKDTLRLLSNHGLAHWLSRGHSASHWQIARLDGSVITQSRVLQRWGDGRVTLVVPTTKSPRALVQEFSNERHVPEDIRPWLGLPINGALFSTPSAQVWVRAASSALLRCLPDEIGPLDGHLKFRGPPRLVLSDPDNAAATWDETTFNVLQVAAGWVFENEREAEMRHVLLSAELARSGSAVESAYQFLREHLTDALESARIAYQMALADSSRDTLQALADLRKTVMDDTTKLSDLSRQLAASIAGALATGIGLIAARVATNAPAGLISTVMVIVAIYLVMVILSGYQVIRLQSRLRANWKPKLYRFLPNHDYEQLVSTPAATAERSFYTIALLGIVVVLVLIGACVWSLGYRIPPNSRSAPQSAQPLQPKTPTLPISSSHVVSGRS